MEKFALINESFSRNYPENYAEFCKEFVYQMSDGYDADTAAEMAATWARPRTRQQRDPLKLRLDMQTRRARVYYHNGRRIKGQYQPFYKTHEEFERIYK